MNPRLTILGAASALLFVIAAILAVAKPGNLGDDESETAAATTTSSSTSSSALATSTTIAASTSTSMSVSSPTTASSGGSGLGMGGNGSIDDRDLSDSGGPEWILPVGGLLLGLGLASRRLALR